MFDRIYKSNSRFVWVRISGSLNDATLQQHVLDYNGECTGRSGLLELADCRELNDVSGLSVLSCTQSAALEMGTQRVVGGRLAVLVSAELHFGLARAYAAIAGNHREEAQVFYDVGEALRWLGTDESLEDLEQFMQTALRVR